MIDTTNDRETDKPAKPCLKRCYLFTPAERCDACPANLPQAQSTKPAQQIRDDQAAESSPMTDKDRAKLERLAARLDPLTPIGPQVAPYFPPTDEDQARMDKMIAGALTKPAQESAQPVSNADELPDWVASLGRQVQEMVADDAQGYCRLRLPDAARALHDYGEQKAELDALRAEVATLKKAAARWTILCNLWAASTELALRQREDGRWEIVQIEDVEGTTFAPLVGDTPDDCISDAMLAAAEVAALRSGDMVMVPRDVATHLETISLEVGGKCHICERFRKLLAAAEEERRRDGERISLCSVDAVDMEERRNG